MFTQFQRIIVLLFLFQFSSPSFCSSQPNSQPDPDELTVLKVAEIATQLGRQFPDSIWPGYNLDQTPFIVYVPERWALLVNAPDSASEFVDYPDEWPPLSTHALYHQGQLGKLEGQLAFDIHVDSVVCAAVGFTGQDEPTFLAFVVHENFHQFQYAHFGEIQWQREELYSIENAENTALACLEVRSLMDAIRFLKTGREDSLRTVVSEFVAIRTFRWLRADPYLRRYEQGQEINEGTAKYVEMKAISLEPRLQLSSSNEGAVLTAVSDLESVTMADAVIEKLDELVQSGSVSPEDMPRNRIYPVGAAQGLILDHLGIDWKLPAQKAGMTFTFSALMGRALEMDSSDVDHLVAGAKSRYGYDTILAISRRMISAYRDGFSADSAVFAAQPGIRVQLRLSGKNLRRSRSSSAKKWLVDNGSRELRSHFNIYVLESALNQTLNFYVKQAGLLELNDWATREKTVIFYCPKITACTIDGTEVTPADGVNRQFEELHLTGDNFEIKTTLNGKISITGHTVSIDLLQ